MLSILVAHSYFLRFDRKQFERARPYPPLATLQVASMLRDSGHRVAVFDAMLAEGTGEYELNVNAAEPQLALFYEDNFNYLSKMCLGRMRRAACEMIACARRRGSMVIAAGSDASDAPAEYLAAGADVVLIGEGLAALQRLVHRLDANPRMEILQLINGINGVAVAVDGKVVTRSSSTAVDQQQAGFAAWDLVDVERYRSMWRNAHGYFSLNMAASRGCSFRCHWCAKPIWGNRYLQRDATVVAAEMTHLKRTFHPDHIWFADDIFGFRVDWVTQFAAAVHAMDGSVPFTIQTRADLVSDGMARALQDANCQEAWLGAESGSQRVLDAMNKGTKVEDIPLACERLAAHGIRVGFFIQLGYMGEQLEDILATRNLVESCRPDRIGVSVAYPLPGTKFYELVKRQLQTKTHWQESSDLEMMFEGTYRSEYYRAIRDLLHDLVESGQHAVRQPEGDCMTPGLSIERRWERLIADERQYRIYPDVRVPQGAV